MNSTPGNRESSGPGFRFHPRDVKGLLLVERSCLGFLAGVNIEFRYAGYVDESA